MELATKDAHHRQYLMALVNTCIAIDPPKLLEFVKSLVMLAGFFFFIAYLICCYKGCGCFEEGIRRLLHGYQVHIHSQIQ